MMLPRLEAFNFKDLVFYFQQYYQLTIIFFPIFNFSAYFINPLFIILYIFIDFTLPFLIIVNNMLHKIII